MMYAGDEYYTDHDGVFGAYELTGDPYWWVGDGGPTDEDYACSECGLHAIHECECEDNNDE